MPENVCAVTVAQAMTHYSVNHCWRFTCPKLQYVNEARRRGGLDRTNCAPQACCTAHACCTACLCNAVVQSWPRRYAVIQNTTDAHLSMLVTGGRAVYDF